MITYKVRPGFVVHYRQSVFVGGQVFTGDPRNHLHQLESCQLDPVNPTEEPGSDQNPENSHANDSPLPPPKAKNDGSANRR